jgi:2-dehydropantoate 2-reductase
MEAGSVAPRTAAIVGAGAIGGWLADALDRAGWRVSLIARGATLEALRGEGLAVWRAGELRRSHPEAGSAAQFGPQDFVFLAVKAHHLPELAPQLAPLIGPCTAVVSATNGIPWWFFQEFGGPLADTRLDSVDPTGSQVRAFPRGSALGAVVHATARVTAPARIEVVAADRLIVGEPGGAPSERVREVTGALRSGGINALASSQIRDEVWGKLWGNMNMNPLSALTRSGTARLLADADVRALCARMMGEMQQCGRLLGLDGSRSADERIEVTRRLGDFRTSMLADVEAGRPLELAPQLGAVVEIAGRLGVAAPYCRSILALARLLSA